MHDLLWHKKKYITIFLRLLLTQTHVPTHTPAHISTETEIFFEQGNNQHQHKKLLLEMLLFPSFFYIFDK